MENSFLKKLKENRVILFDGATGSLLQQMGVKTDSAPEMLNLTHKNILQEIGKGYINSGCEILETNTFGANRIKLKNFGVENKVHELNCQGIKIMKEIAPEGVLIAASIGPIGKFIKPVGDLDFNEAVDVFSEQVKGCADGGADLIIFETFSDLSEIKAAILAAKNVTDLPVVATMTFQEDLRTLLGTSPEVAAIALESMKVSMIGATAA
jgi:5-methyltetrahydrofolate--homocysteine methyltransferase